MEQGLNRASAPRLPVRVDRLPDRSQLAPPGGRAEFPVAASCVGGAELRPGVSTFDLYDDTRSQVYRGALRETATTTTAMKVRTCTIHPRR